MKTLRIRIPALLLAVGLAVGSLSSTSCMRAATPTTAQPPNSPQTTVALTVKTVADADLAGVKTVIALRDAGKLSQANTTSRLCSYDSILRLTAWAHVVWYSTP